MFYGVSIPHIEDISCVSEGFYFIGIGNDRSVDVVDSDVPVISCSGIATTKQTTLMWYFWMNVILSSQNIRKYSFMMY